MSTVPSVSAAGFAAYAVRNPAYAAKAPQAQSTQPVSPVAKVQLADSQAAYTASLDTLRTANKMMMGYLLNIQV